MEQHKIYSLSRSLHPNDQIASTGGGTGKKWGGTTRSSPASKKLRFIFILTPICNSNNGDLTADVLGSGISEYRA